MDKKERRIFLNRNEISKSQLWYKGLTEKPTCLYNQEQLDLYKKYVNDKIGKFELVYHELYSPDIHLDILVIPPNEEDNYYKLVTKGMGAYKMNVPDVIKNYELDRAELVMYLPPDWDLDFSKEENGWVIKQLKIIARTAIVENGWVGFGHSFATDEKALEKVAPNTQLAGSVLLMALDKDFKYFDLELPDIGKINFYQVFPLYKEELEYKNQFGTKKLMERFDIEDVFPIVNINRRNYCEGIDLEKEVENAEKKAIYELVNNFCESCTDKEWDDLTNDYCISNNENYMGEVREKLETAIYENFKSSTEEGKEKIINKLSKYIIKEKDELEKEDDFEK